LHDNVAVAVNQSIVGAAGLGADTAIAAASRDGLAQVTLAAVGNA
jgi:hypothetical protein